MNLLRYLLLSLSVFLVSCTGGESNVDRGNREQVFHYGNGAEPQGLDPHVVTGVPEIIASKASKFVKIRLGQ